ncbi:MAG: hypothetical protein KJO79_09195 [Verrucomicrobiae bacterium]|nr:hypothetical protein [Verrucomicrobiae bacterium]NNJ87344.1 hypothetical protein [Akkermansiaceae bacterium]
MSDTPTHYSEYIKQGIFIVLILAVSLFGIKSCRKYQNKRDVIIQLTSCASDSAAYEQFYTENAHSNLYKSMYQLYLGVQLGETAPELLKAVLEDDEALFSTEKTSDLPIRKTLIRDSLLSNYDNCVKLGIFDDLGNIEALSKGEAPRIQKGPASGELTIIKTIVPDALLPGVGKLLPNLMISPPPEKPGPNKNARPNNFEIARAKQLTQSLSTAGLIDTDAFRAVSAYYEKLTLESPPNSNP